MKFPLKFDLTPVEPTGPEPIEREHFVMIPESVCKCRAVSMGAKLVWARLKRYAGQDGRCYPSHKTLGAEFGLSARQAKRYVDELERLALLRKRRRGQGTSNEYFLTREPRLDDLPLRRTRKSDWTSTSTLEPTSTSAQERTLMPKPERTSVSRKESQSVVRRKKNQEETAKSALSVQRATDRRPARQANQGGKWVPSAEDARAFGSMILDITEHAPDEKFCRQILATAAHKATGLGEVMDYCRTKAQEYPPRTNGFFKAVVADRFGPSESERQKATADRTQAEYEALRRGDYAAWQKLKMG